MARLHQARLPLGGRPVPWRVLGPATAKPGTRATREGEPFSVRFAGQSSVLQAGRIQRDSLILAGFLAKPPGTRFDVTGSESRRITGYVTSGRRWHRRIPSFIHRFGAAFVLQREMPMTKHLSRLVLVVA